MSEEQTNNMTMELRLPRHPGFVRTARLAASGIAALVPFDVDRIDDLRITVNEMCSTLFELGDGPVLLRFTLIEDGITVVGTTTPTGPSQLDKDRFDLTQQIIDVLADDHQLQIDDDEVRFSVTLLSSDGAGFSDEAEGSAG